MAVLKRRLRASALIFNGSGLRIATVGAGAKPATASEKQAPKS